MSDPRGCNAPSTFNNYAPGLLPANQGGDTADDYTPAGNEDDISRWFQGAVSFLCLMKKPCSYGTKTPRTS